MIELTPRSREIAEFILEASQPLTVRKLASALNVSPRTIRYDVDLLKQWFKERGFILQAKPRIGVWVEGPAADRAGILDSLRNWGTAWRVIDKHDRVQLLLLSLIRSNKHVALSTLAEQMNVSRGTVANDMRDAAQIAESCNLTIVGKPRFGYQICGDEESRRELAYLLLVNLVDESKWIRLLSLRSNATQESDCLPANQSRDWFSRDSMRRTLGIGKIVYAEMGSTLTDSAFIALVVHLSIALERIISGFTVKVDSARLSGLRETEACEAGRRIADGIKTAFSVNLPEDEIKYIALHLSGRRGTKEKNVSSNALTCEELSTCVQMLLREIQAKFGFSLESDEDLHEGLFRQLQTGGRERPETCVLAQRLKGEYPDLFLAVSEAAGRFLEPMSLDCGDIGDLCMHIRASMERQEKPRAYRALVACSTGAGSAALLRARLNREFPELRIVKTTPALNVLMEVDSLKAELVISTVSLPKMPIPSVVVSPLLMPAEIARVRALIHRSALARDQSRPDDVNIRALELARLLDGVETAGERVLIIRDFLWNTLERASASDPVEPSSFAAREELLRFAADLAGSLGLKVEKTALTGMAIHLSLAVQRWRWGQFSVESRSEIDRWTARYAAAMQATDQALSKLASSYGVASPPVEESVAVMRYLVGEPSSPDALCPKTG